MRLIDADVFEVISLQCKSEEFCNGVMWMLEQIDNQPTAYDIDKVVEELKESSEKFTEYDIEIDDYVSQFAVGIHKAIEIVKQQLREQKK